MVSYNNNQFVTEEEIGKLVDIPFSEFGQYLKPKIKFEGLVWIKSGLIYVEGFFEIMNSESRQHQFSQSEIEGGYHISEPDIPCVEILKSIIGTSYCNVPAFENKVFRLKTPIEIKEIYYSYSSIVSRMKKFRGPPPKDINELTKKEYYYDVHQVNQKSNFTLNEACRIAANLPLKELGGFNQKPPTPILLHYQEIIAECVTGHNQHKFHLMTKELWLYRNDENHGEHSVKIPKSYNLTVSCKIDIVLTIISKNEFLRWCKYMNIDTGLNYSQKVFDESVEALKIELNESETEVSRLRDLYLSQPVNIPIEITYPPELKLAIDAFEQLCYNQEKRPTNKVIEEWLKSESKKRGITHKDGSDIMKGLSNVKAERIASIIKSK